MTSLRQSVGGVVAALTITLGVVLGLLSFAAFAEESSSGGTGPALPQGGAGSLDITWASNHFALDFKGVPGEVVTGQDSFIFDLVAVPGTAVHRTMKISNVGTADGVLETAVLDATVLSPAGAVNQELAKLSNIYWSFGGGPTSQVGFGAVVNDAAVIATAGGTTHGRYLLDKVDLPAGTSVLMTLGWELPPDAPLGNRQDNDSVSLSFDVDFLLRPPTNPPNPSRPTSEPPEPTLDPTVQPRPSDSADGGNNADVWGDKGTGSGGYGYGQGRLPFTGANPYGLAFSSAFCLLAGLLILAARRRRREEEPAS